MKFALSLQRKFDVFPFVNYATPLFGTKLYDIATKRGLLTKQIDSHALLLATHHQGDGLITTEEFTPHKLKEMTNIFHSLVLLDVFIKSILRPKFLMENIRIAMRNPYIIKRYLLGH